MFSSYLQVYDLLVGAVLKIYEGLSGLQEYATQ